MLSSQLLRQRIASSGNRSLVLKMQQDGDAKNRYIERLEKSSSFLHKKSPDYILPCFNVHPQNFPQTVIQSDGSTFTIRVCTPRPLLKLNKDTRNHSTWNPDASTSYDDSVAQVAKFAKKYGNVEIADLFSE